MVAFIGTPASETGLESGDPVASPTGAQLGETLLAICYNRLLFNDNPNHGATLSGFTRIGVGNFGGDTEGRFSVLLKETDAADVAGTTYVYDDDDPDNSSYEGTCGVWRLDGVVTVDQIVFGSNFGGGGTVPTITTTQSDALAVFASRSSTGGATVSSPWVAETGTSITTIYSRQVPSPATIGGESASGSFNTYAFVTFDVYETVVATEPDAPTGLSVVAGNTEVDLTWTAPASDGGSAITGYEIRSSTNGGSTWSSPTATGSTTTSFTATGLTNDTEYIFQVRAVNAIGPSAWSASSSSVTPAAPTGGYRLTMSGDRTLTMAGDFLTLMSGSGVAPTGLPLNRGDTQVTAIYLGDVEVDALYVGDVQVF